MKKGYFPTHSENRMKNEGNVALARKNFMGTKNEILYNLVKQRYSWMNQYITEEDKNIIELGCGAGLSKLFIKNKNLLLTDVLDNEWVDKKIDALDIDYPDESLDVIICSEMIHHLASPYYFLEHASKKLRSGGRLIIQDMYTGVLMKIVLRIMRHEGYSDFVDVYNKNEICNSADDPWSANCSIPKLLFFKDEEKLEKEFTMYIVKKRELNECFMFYLSGGVIAKTYSPNIQGGGGIGFRSLTGC